MYNSQPALRMMQMLFAYVVLVIFMDILFIFRVHIYSIMSWMNAKLKNHAVYEIC